MRFKGFAGGQGLADLGVPVGNNQNGLNPMRVTMENASSDTILDIY